MIDKALAVELTRIAEFDLATAVSLATVAVVNPIAARTNLQRGYGSGVKGRKVADQGLGNAVVDRLAPSIARRQGVILQIASQATLTDNEFRVPGAPVILELLDRQAGLALEERNKFHHSASGLPGDRA